MQKMIEDWDGIAFVTTLYRDTGQSVVFVVVVVFDVVVVAGGMLLGIVLPPLYTETQVSWLLTP